MNSSLEARRLEPAEYERWSQFVAGAPSGSVYSLPAYLAALCEAAGGRFWVLGVFKGTELHGGIGVYESSSLGGRVAANRYLLYYHSPVLRDYGTAHPPERTSKQLAVLDAVADSLAHGHYDRLLLHVRHPIDDVRAFQARGWNVTPSWTYVLSIGDLGLAWARMDQNLRRLVRRAEAGGLRCVEDDDFESFFRLHADTHSRKGAPLYLPEERFRRYFELLRAGDLCRLFHVRTEAGVSIAAQLVLTGPFSLTHTVGAAADPTYLQAGAAPFLRWRVAEALSAAGYTANDLTDAALNDVTRFKSQLGGELVTNWVVAKPESPRYRLYAGTMRALGVARRSTARFGRPDRARG